MNALMEVYGDTVFAVRDRHRDWAVAHGISREAIWTPPAPFGAGRIETSGRAFEFNKDGAPAVIVPVSDSYDIECFEYGLADLLAFQPNDPHRWWALRDIMPLLNTEAVEQARTLIGIDYPLAINSTPLAWLQRNRDGVVILDWNCCLPLWLGGVPRLLCDTEELARKLNHSFMKPRQAIPDIRYEGVRNAA